MRRWEMRKVTANPGRLSWASAAAVAAAAAATAAARAQTHCRGPSCSGAAGTARAAAHLEGRRQGPACLCVSVHVKLHVQKNTIFFSSPDNRVGICHAGVYTNPTNYHKNATFIFVVHHTLVWPSIWSIKQNSFCVYCEII